jgi:choline kinase
MIEVGGQTILTRLVRLLEFHVDTIHLVVGYREEIVVDYCAHHHRNVVIVRNPNFRTTNTAHSFALGARYLPGKVLYTDGDILIAPNDLASFLERAADQEIMVGLTESKSEHAVFADASRSAGRLVVNGFSREVKTSYEWANIVTGPATLMDRVDGYVFEYLATKLPLQALMLQLSEVDTAADLKAAEDFVRHTIK